MMDENMNLTSSRNREVMRPKFMNMHLQRRPWSAAVPMPGRWAWLVPVGMLILIPFACEGDMLLALSALAATIACVLAIAATNYQPTSLVSMVALTHILYYPLAVWSNLLLPTPAVIEDLWVNAYLAMWGCTVGITALAIGSWMANTLRTEKFKPSVSQKFFPPTPLKFNIFLITILVPAALVKAALGMYFHSALSIYNFENRWYLNMISLFIYISLTGAYLQTYRYTRTHSVRDARWAVVLCIMAIMVFLPSGSRGESFGFLPLLVLAFTAWESDLRKILYVGVIALLFILIYAAGIEGYRNDPEVQRLSLRGKYISALQSPVQSQKEDYKSLDDPVTRLISRLSDFVATGRIIAETPGSIPYRGLEKVEYWWQGFIPGFLKLIPDRIDFNDGGEMCIRYGVVTGRGGSSPVMIIGDLFSRWGWKGVVLGMLLIGFVLRNIDLHILNHWSCFTIFFFVLFSRYAITITSASLFNVFITFFRELPAMALTAYLVARLAMTSPPKTGPNVKLDPSSTVNADFCR